jgi:D-sedoheptulose 7-phosphate isomerase
MHKFGKVPEASGYLAQLHRILCDTVVTDGDGVAMGLDQGGQAAVDILLRARAMQEMVALVGNGGSAAIAAHMHNDLCCAVGIRAISFTDAPLLTALSNDHGYEQAFERPLRMWAGIGGVLVGVSSSGKSENILRAAQVAREHGMKVITMSGFSPDNPLRRLGNLNFHVASESYGYVELAHSVLAHYLTDAAAAVLRAGDQPGEAPSIFCASESERLV